MTPEQIDKYRKAADDGSIPDSENPLFLFQGTSSKLLVMALNKEFTFASLAKLELENRGQNMKGEWVGFNKSPGRKQPVRKRGPHP